MNKTLSLALAASTAVALESGEAWTPETLTFEAFKMQLAPEI